MNRWYILFIFFFCTYNLNSQTNPSEYQLFCDSMDIVTSLTGKTKAEKAQAFYLSKADHFAKLNSWADWYDCNVQVFRNNQADSYLSVMHHLETQKKHASRADLYHAGKFYYLLAYVQYSLGKIQSAIDSQKKAHELFSTLDDYTMQINSLTNLGIYYSFFNDHEASIIYAEKLLETLKADDLERRISTYHNLFDYYMLKDDVGSAIETNKTAIELEGQASNASLLNSATLYLQSNEYDQALQIINNIAYAKDDVNTKIRVFQQKASIHENKGELDQALRFRLDLLETQMERNAQREYAKELQKIAQLQVKQGAFESALKSSHEVLQIFCQAYVNPDIYSLPERDEIIPEAWVMEALKSKATAISQLKPDNINLINRAYDLSIHSLDLLRNSFAVNESRYDITTKMSQLFNDVIAFNTEQYQLTADQKYYEIAFRNSQLKKAFVFKSSKNLRETFKDSKVDIDLREQYFDLLSKRENPDENRSLILDSIAQLTQTLQSNYTSLKRRLSNQTASIQDIQAQLLDRQVLIKYDYTDEVLLCFVIHKEKVSLIKKNLPKDFSKQVNAYQVQLTQFQASNIRSSEAQFISLANDIYEHTFHQLIDPQDNIAMVCIIPDGPLENISFENLPFRNIKSWRETDGLLLSKYAFNYNYHTSQIINQSKEIQTIDDIVSIGLSYEDHPKFSNLDYVEDEVSSIAKLLNSDQILNHSVGKSSVAQAFLNNDLVHFAGHAHSDQTDLSECYLALRKTNDQSYDRFSYLDAIALNLTNQMVVLSACNTNSGRGVALEGVLSLSRALIESGTQSTVASAWNTPDRISKEIIQSYYQNLMQGMNKAMALQSAKLTFLTDDALSSPSERNPAFWSNWKLSGDISPLKFKSKSNLWMYAILTLIGIIIFVYLSPFQD